MNKEELYKMVEHELQWLKYYALSESRSKLTIESNIYDELIPIGYTKRIIPLATRCAAGILENNEIVRCQRDITKNRLTALEVYWQMYPEERLELINKLK